MSATIGAALFVALRMLQYIKNVQKYRNKAEIIDGYPYSNAQ